MILSHNISTVLTAIFAFLYCIVNVKSIVTTRVKKGLVIDIIFILLITSFFYLPFLQSKFYTNYRVYDKDAMSTKESFLNNCLSLKDLFIVKNDSIFVFEIGLPVILMLGFSFLTFQKLEENKKEYIFFLSVGLLCLLMTTKYFPWKYMPSSFYIIQLPWRLLVFSSFFLSIICGINMMTLIKDFNIKDVIVISIICILYIFTKYNLIQYSDNVVNVEDCQIYNVTGQNNEWLPGMGRLEYLPSKAYENSFYIAIRKPEIEVLTGKTLIEEYEKIGTNMKAKIETEEKSVLELPYINYLGYSAKLDGMSLNTFETQNGFLGCEIEANENGNLEVEYKRY